MEKILVLVWNSFTNDKRVLQISESLLKNDYVVSVIAAKAVQGLKVEDKIHFKDKELKIIRIPLFSSLYSKRGSEVYKKKSGDKKDKTMWQKLIDGIKNSSVRMILVSFLNWLSFNLGLLFMGIKHQPKIVYCNDLNTLTIGFIVSRLFKAKIIYDSHELWMEGGAYGKSTLLRKWMWRNLESYLIKRVDEVIVTTSMRAQVLEEKYKISGVNVIRNSPHYQEIKDKTLLRDNIPDDKVLFLYCGALKQERGILQVLEIIARIPEAYLVYMGSGDGRMSLLEKIEKKGLSNRVFVRNPVSPLDVVSYASSADVGLQLLSNININHYSTISNKLLEYIMAECAVIASDFPEIRKIVVGNDLGLVVDPEDEEQVFNACKLMVEDRVKLANFKRNSAKAKKNYCWEQDELLLLKLIAGDK